MDKVDFNSLNVMVREYLEFHDMKDTIQALEAEEREKLQAAGPKNALVKRGGVI